MRVFCPGFVCGGGKACVDRWSGFSVNGVEKLTDKDSVLKFTCQTCFVHLKQIEIKFLCQRNKNIEKFYMPDVYFPNLNMIP